MSSTDLQIALGAAGPGHGQRPRRTAVLLGGLGFASGSDVAAPQARIT